MRTDHVSSHHELMQLYRDQLETDIKAGRFEPFVYPYLSFGSAILIVYLLIPHQRFPLARRLRWLVFSVILAFEVHVIVHCRNIVGGNGYGIGICFAWGTIWAAALTLFTDPQNEYKRISRSNLSTEADRHSKGSAESAAKSTEQSRGTKTSETSNPQLKPSSSSNTSRFVWQRFPSGLVERLEWITDVGCNFRGLGWNWQLSALPSPPHAVQAQLRNSEDETRQSDPDVQIGPLGHKAFYSKSALMKQRLRTCAYYYAVLDLLKTFMMHDPYFWGLVDCEPPTIYWDVLRNSPALLKCFRLVVSTFAVKKALEAIFAPGALLFAGLLRKHSPGAWSEPWLYPDLFGSFSKVLDQGIAGWWGGWWHQIFRVGFTAPSSWLIKTYDLDRQSTSTKTLQLFIAFTISGTIHACGSYTQLGPSRPLSGPFTFFVLQAVGIIVQLQVSAFLQRYGPLRRLSRNQKRIANSIFVFGWFYLIGPIILNDFARGGVWLFEPVPFSIFRALGFGVKGDSWWCWSGLKPTWHNDSRWWRSGFAL